MDTAAIIYNPPAPDHQSQSGGLKGVEDPDHIYHLDEDIVTRRRVVAATKTKPESKPRSSTGSETNPISSGSGTKPSSSGSGSEVVEGNLPELKDIQLDSDSELNDIQLDSDSFDEMEVDYVNSAVCPSPVAGNGLRLNRLVQAVSAMMDLKRPRNNNSKSEIISNANNPPEIK